MANGNATSKLVFWILGIMGSALLAAVGLTVAMQRHEVATNSARLTTAIEIQNSVRERVKALEKSDEAISDSLHEIRSTQVRMDEKLDRLLRRN